MGFVGFVVGVVMVCINYWKLEIIYITIWYFDSNLLLRI